MLDKNAELSESEMAGAGGFIGGFVLAAMILGRFSRLFILLQSLLLMGLALAFVPWTTSLWAVDTVHTAIGVGLAIFLSAGNIVCLDYWGKRSGPYMQAVHFCLSLGLLTGPFLVDPLSQTPLPKAIQDYANGIVVQGQNLSATTTISPISIPMTMSINDVDITSDRRRRRKREVDQLLVDILGNDEGEKKAKAKPKPSFTDARKLDYSQDWEKIKVADLATVKAAATTTTKTTTSTSSSTSERLENGPSIEEIFDFIDEDEDAISTSTKKSKEMEEIESEMQQIQEEMKRSQTILASLKRPKRSSSGFRRRGQPPPVIGTRPLGVGGGRMNYPGRYPDYNDLSVMPEYPSIYDDEREERVEEMFDNAPKQVQDAVDTITDFMKDGKIDVASTSIKTTTTSTTTTTTTTTSTTTTTTITTTTTSRKKKPSFATDNSTDLNNAGKIRRNEEKDLTLGKALQNFGVQQTKIGFVLDSVYHFFLALILFFCLCYNPREPRGVHSSSLEDLSSYERGSRLFKISITFLLFLFNLIHWGIMVSLGRVLPSFAPIVNLEPARLQQAFFGAFTLTRFTSMFALSGLFSPALLIFLSLLLTFAGAIVIVVVFSGTQNAALVWTGILLQAVGLSPLFPASLVWAEPYVPMTAPVVSTICAGTAIGEVLFPLIFTQIGPFKGVGASIGVQWTRQSSGVEFAALGSITLAILIFVCAYLVARKRGVRNTDKARSTVGYQLAATQDDSTNRGLLLDDDDEEDDDEDEGFEVETAESMRLRLTNNTGEDKIDA